MNHILTLLSAGNVLNCDLTKTLHQSNGCCHGGVSVPQTVRHTLGELVRTANFPTCEPDVCEDKFYGSILLRSNPGPSHDSTSDNVGLHFYGRDESSFNTINENITLHTTNVPIDLLSPNTNTQNIDVIGTDQKGFKSRVEMTGFVSTSGEKRAILTHLRNSTIFRGHATINLTVWPDVHIRVYEFCNGQSIDSCPPLPSRLQSYVI